MTSHFKRAQPSSFPAARTAIGPVTDALCQSLFAKAGRAPQPLGIVSLARRYPQPDRQACAMALQDAVCSYEKIHALTERLTAEALAGLDAPVQGELVLA